MSDSEFWNRVFQIIPSFVGALAAYLAIKENLAVLNEKVRQHGEDIKETKESVRRAHERIDKES